MVEALSQSPAPPAAPVLEPECGERAGGARRDDEAASGKHEDRRGDLSEVRGGPDELAFRTVGGGHGCDPAAAERCDDELRRLIAEAIGVCRLLPDRDQRRDTVTRQGHLEHPLPSGRREPVERAP